MIDSTMLSSSQIQTWKEEGAVIFQLPEQVVDPALKWLNINFTIDQMDGNHFDFGNPDKKFEFPTFINPLDDLVLSEPLILAAQELLDTQDVRLIQADLWPKIGVTNENHDAQANTDQRMHMDYGNNTVLHPQWDTPDVVAAVVYYDDSEETGGETGYVTRRGIDDPVYQAPYVNMPGQAANPFFNDRATVENWFKENDPNIYDLRRQLYEREQVVQFKPGTILFYRHDLWHRGRPLVAGKLRRVHNLAWKRADARGISHWNEGFSRKSYYGDVESLIARSTPLQRSVLDFPLPGDDYWNLEKLRNVEARFANYGFDASVYLDKLKTKPSL
ncbi:hypothetical protein OAE08_01100 [Gammaproteobacteria bacterium]|nr:hypothetical protein [Gammaproteobacteria bacterium]